MDLSVRTEFLQTAWAGLPGPGSVPCLPWQALVWELCCAQAGWGSLGRTHRLPLLSQTTSTPTNSTLGSACAYG